MKRYIKRRILYGISILVFGLFVITAFLITNEKNNRIETEKTMQQVKANLREAIDISYNQKPIKNKNKKIVSLVGNDLAIKLEEFSKESISQSGTGSSGVEKAEKVLIKVGELNQSNDSFPIDVTVYYQTPPIKLNTDVSHYQGKNELILQGKTRFKLNYSINSKQLVVDSYKDKIIEFPVDDYKMGLVDVEPSNKDMRFIDVPKNFEGKLKYQFAFDGVDRNKSYSYPKYESTWYVYNRCLQLEMQIPDELGLGKDWASKGDMKRSHEVRAGYIVVVPGGLLGTSKANGTVCFIEAVLADESVLVSESGIFRQSISYMYITEKTLKKCKIIVPKNWN